MYCLLYIASMPMTAKSHLCQGFSLTGSRPTRSRNGQKRSTHVSFTFIQAVRKQDYSHSHKNAPSKNINLAGMNCTCILCFSPLAPLRIGHACLFLNGLPLALNFLSRCIAPQRFDRSGLSFTLAGNIILWFIRLAFCCCIFSLSSLFFLAL